MTGTLSLFRQGFMQAYSMVLLGPRTALDIIWQILIWPKYIWHLLGKSPRSHEQYVDFVPRSYEEEEEMWEKGVERRSHSLRLVYHSLYLTWHVKVTFRGTLHSAPISNTTKQARKELLMNLCLCIDLNNIKLLDDTVTEIIVANKSNITPHGSLRQMLPIKRRSDIEAEFSIIVDNLYVWVQEDPSRVRFPTIDTELEFIPTKEVSEIIKDDELGMGVYKAYLIGDHRTYVYKEVDRPLYEPRDSETLEQELRNLLLLSGVDGVVQLVAAGVSRNPYQTMDVNSSNGQTVLRGILLEYHSNGTLQKALESPRDDYPWLQWAIQITNALRQLHEFGITHMDMKPTNIVLSSVAMDAVLIDVSGVGGTTRDWLSPEMRDVTEPLSEEFNSRIQNDIWALGNIISLMANAASDKTVTRLLTRLSQLATAEPPLRISLQDAHSLLSQP